MRFRIHYQGSSRANQPYTTELYHGSDIFLNGWIEIPLNCICRGLNVIHYKVCYKNQAKYQNDES